MVARATLQATAPFCLPSTVAKSTGLRKVNEHTREEKQAIPFCCHSARCTESGMWRLCTERTGALHRRVAHQVSSRWASKTPLGGFTAEELPSSRSRRLHQLSDNKGARSSRVEPAPGFQRRPKETLDRARVSTSSLQSFFEAAPTTTARRTHRPTSAETVDDIDEAPATHAALAAVQCVVDAASSSPSMSIVAPTTSNSGFVASPTRVTTTEGAPELDKLEQDYIAARAHSPSQSFTVDEVYDTDTLREDRADDPSPRKDDGYSQRHAMNEKLRHSRRRLCDTTALLQISRKATLRGTVTPTIQTSTVKPHRATNRSMRDKHEPPAPATLSPSDAASDLPASANPHIPDGCGKADARAAASPSPLEAPTKPLVYDAYVTRPHDHTPLRLRGAEFWDDASNRLRLEASARFADDEVAHAYLREGPMDTASPSYHAEEVRREALLFLQAHPVNEMIQDQYVRIVRIAPPNSEPIQLANIASGNAPVVTVGEARIVAKEHGLDLIRIGETTMSPLGDTTKVALCEVGDHRQMMREMTRMKLWIRGGVQPSRVEQCVEVPFRGGTHPFAIRYKAIGVAKLLVKRTPVRVNLTDFGTAREGFPVFRTILDEIKAQCAPLKAFHKAGPVQASYDEIHCMLFPSTTKSPKLSVMHPSASQLDEVKHRRIMQDEKESLFDGYYDAPTANERQGYEHKIVNGTAWSHRDEGLSLQRQRDIKVMLGYLPKGNREIYAARGDVNVKFPFRAYHPTSTEKWSYPRDSNLEQSARASALLGNRLSMNVAEMHDRGETPDKPSAIERFYYQVQGPALEVGEMKEAMGLKTNRKRNPALAPGWATLGLHTREEVDRRGGAK